MSPTQRANRVEMYWKNVSASFKYLVDEYRYSKGTIEFYNVILSRSCIETVRRGGVKGENDGRKDIIVADAFRCMA